MPPVAAAAAAVAAAAAAAADAAAPTAACGLETARDGAAYPRVAPSPCLPVGGARDGACFEAGVALGAASPNTCGATVSGALARIGSVHSLARFSLRDVHCESPLDARTPWLCVTAEARPSH